MPLMPPAHLKSVLNSISTAAGRSQSSMSKLGSGYAIQSAKDNAASLALSIDFDAELRSLQQASRNTSEGVGMLRTAEGGMESASESLIRLKELAVQAGSSTLSDDQRAMIQTEVDGILEGMDNVAATTEYNGQQLLDGSEGTMTIQVGTGAGPENQISFETQDMGVAALGLAGASVMSEGDAGALIDTVDAAIDVMSEQRAEVGSTINSLESAYDNNQESLVNNTDALSRLRDADYASESTNLASSLVQQQFSVSMLAQANTSASNVMKLIG
jgi:flagellin